MPLGYTTIVLGRASFTIIQAYTTFSAPRSVSSTPKPSLRLMVSSSVPHGQLLSSRMSKEGSAADQQFLAARNSRPKTFDVTELSAQRVSSSSTCYGIFATMGVRLTAATSDSTTAWSGSGTRTSSMYNWILGVVWNARSASTTSPLSDLITLILTKTLRFILSSMQRLKARVTSPKSG